MFDTKKQGRLVFSVNLLQERVRVAWIAVQGAEQSDSCFILRIAHKSGVSYVRMATLNTDIDAWGRCITAMGSLATFELRFTADTATTTTDSDNDAVFRTVSQSRGIRDKSMSGAAAEWTWYGLERQSGNRGHSKRTANSGEPIFSTSRKLPATKKSGLFSWTVSMSNNAQEHDSQSIHSLGITGQHELKNWSVGHVMEWLGHIPFKDGRTLRDELGESFEENEIDGTVLVSMSAAGICDSIGSREGSDQQEVLDCFHCALELLKKDSAHRTDSWSFANKIRCFIQADYHHHCRGRTRERIFAVMMDKKRFKHIYLDMTADMSDVDVSNYPVHEGRKKQKCRKQKRHTSRKRNEQHRYHEFGSGEETIPLPIGYEMALDTIKKQLLVSQAQSDTIELEGATLSHDEMGEETEEEDEQLIPDVCLDSGDGDDDEFVMIDRDGIPISARPVELRLFITELSVSEHCSVGRLFHPSVKNIPRLCEDLPLGSLHAVLLVDDLYLEWGKSSIIVPKKLDGDMRRLLLDTDQHVIPLISIEADYRLHFMDRLADCIIEWNRDVLHAVHSSSTGLRLEQDIYGTSADFVRAAISILSQIGVPVSFKGGLPTLLEHVKQCEQSGQDMGFSFTCKDFNVQSSLVDHKSPHLFSSRSDLRSFIRLLLMENPFFIDQHPDAWSALKVIDSAFTIRNLFKQ